MTEEVLKAARDVCLRADAADALVAELLARDIMNRDTFDMTCDDVIVAGIEAAIEEIDDSTFDAAFDVIQTAVSASIEADAKATALRMLRELAAKAEREAAAAV